MTEDGRDAAQFTAEYAAAELITLRTMLKTIVEDLQDDLNELLPVVHRLIAIVGRVNSVAKVLGDDGKPQ